MSIFLSLGSIALGLLGILLPILSLKYNKFQSLAPLFSLTCCSLAIWFQLLEIKHRVAISDFAAIEDTINAISSVSIMLIVITLAINLVVGLIPRKKAEQSL